MVVSSDQNGEFLLSVGSEVIQDVSLLLVQNRRRGSTITAASVRSQSMKALGVVRPAFRILAECRGIFQAQINLMEASADDVLSTSV